MKKGGLLVTTTQFILRIEIDGFSNGNIQRNSSRYLKLQTLELKQELIAVTFDINLVVVEFCK